jgi:hypothetical protein
MHISRPAVMSAQSATSVNPAPAATPARAFAWARISSSYLVWLALVAYLVLVKLILDTFLPRAFADPSQAAVFGWAPLGLFSGLGLVGVWLSRKTGFPEAWDTRLPAWQRLLLPVLVGLVFGGLYVGADRLAGFSSLIAARHGLAQQYTDRFRWR